MAKYVKNPHPIEAVRFDGEIVGEYDIETGEIRPGTCPPWIRTPILEVKTLNEAGKLENGQIRLFGRTLFVRSAGMITEIGPGDWLLRCRNGQISGCSDELFRREYRRV